MATPSPQTIDNSKPRLPLGGYLFTPPENTVDSFSYQEEEPDNEHYVQQWKSAVQAKPTALLPPLVRTPPASPQNTALPSIAPAAGYSVHDSPLFPQQAPSERAQSQRPLFERSSSPAPIPSIEQTKPLHTLEQPPNNPQPRHKIFPFSLAFTTEAQALAYFRQSKAEVRAMGRTLPEPKKTPDCRRSPEDARLVDSLTRSAGVTKSRSAPRIPSKPKAPLAASPVKSTPRKPRAPRQRTTSINDFVDSAFPARDQNSKHKRAQASKKVEPAEWTEIPDFSPPVSDLDDNPHSLKVRWDHAATRLKEDDPARHLLHEQEVRIAEELRLNATQYLTNKRRIFQAKVHALKNGKNFTKTAAQSACSVDVNKASQLWMAFEGVGWFKPEWFAQYLD